MADGELSYPDEASETLIEVGRRSSYRSPEGRARERVDGDTTDRAPEDASSALPCVWDSYPSKELYYRNFSSWRVRILRACPSTKLNTDRPCRRTTAVFSLRYVSVSPHLPTALIVRAQSNPRAAFEVIEKWIQDPLLPDEAPFHVEHVVTLIRSVAANVSLTSSRVPCSSPHVARRGKLHCRGQQLRAVLGALLRVANGRRKAGVCRHNATTRKSPRSLSLTNTAPRTDDYSYTRWHLGAARPSSIRRRVSPSTYA